MTSIFDGMAGALNGIFGAPVTITPEGSAAFDVRAVFRNEPVDVEDSDGRSIRILSPTLMVQRDLAPDIARGDLVAPSVAPGQTFVVVNALPNGSPANDAFIVCELEEAHL